MSRFAACPRNRRPGPPERCLAKGDRTEGYPYTSESRPGLRAMPGLEPGELAGIERLVRKATGAKELWVQRTPGGGTLDHDRVQVVGEGEGEPRPPVRGPARRERRPGSAHRPRRMTG